MTIQVNGKEKDFQGTVYELIASYNLKPETIVVERNGEVIHREQYNNVCVEKGDIFEIIRFVGGG